VGRKVLVTGGGGFVGQWLARALLQHGDDVILTGLAANCPQGILDASEREATQWVRADIRDHAAVERMLIEGQPQLVVHLAGVSFVPDAEGAPATAFEINVVGAVRLLTAAASALARGMDPLILIVGSATQYGVHPASEMPLTESADQRPITSYGATKAAQEIAALQIRRSTGLRLLCTRSFSHSGVGHDSVFLIPSLMNRIRNLDPRDRVVRIGNDVIRDYLHVDDAVSAYLALADDGVPGQVYNVCSGTGVSVSEIARAALHRAGIEADVTVDSKLMRSSDIPILVGSPARLMADTGWRATKTYTDILDDFLAAGR
jgi:GDP-4-dehydro-6-deoxy-D-mannose reductase